MLNDVSQRNQSNNTSSGKRTFAPIPTAPALFEVYHALANTQGYTLSVTNLIQKTGRSEASVRTTLQRGVNKGYFQRLRWGVYTISSESEFAAAQKKPTPKKKVGRKPLPNNAKKVSVMVELTPYQKNRVMERVERRQRRGEKNASMSGVIRDIVADAVRRERGSGTDELHAGEVRVVERVVKHTPWWRRLFG